MARDIIKRLILSEKSSRLGALNQYVLEVDKAATKPQIRQAVEEGVISRLRYRNYCALYEEIKQEFEENRYS